MHAAFQLHARKDLVLYWNWRFCFVSSFKTNTKSQIAFLVVAAASYTSFLPFLNKSSFFSILYSHQQPINYPNAPFTPQKSIHKSCLSPFFPWNLSLFAITQFSRFATSRTNTPPPHLLLTKTAKMTICQKEAKLPHNPLSLIVGNNGHPRVPQKRKCGKSNEAKIDGPAPESNTEIGCFLRWLFYYLLTLNA